LAERIAALSLATDLGLGQPMTHALRMCLLTLRLGRALGLREQQLADTYYTTLLRFVGCTADSYDLREFAGGDDISFGQRMVMVAGGTRDEIASDLMQFLTEAGVSGDTPARAREAVESPTGVGAQMVSAHCEVATMLATRVRCGNWSRRQDILVNHTAETIATLDANLIPLRRRRHRRTCRAGWREGQRSRWPWPL
jgi:hypothetical protein